MSIEAKITNGGAKIKITGLDLDIMGKGDWRKAIDDMGEALQEMIADSFANERVAGSSQLKTNTTAWNKRKKSLNLDSRRGHATGNLQDQLEGKRLYVIGAVRDGSATIRFLEQRLYGRVDYAEYYADQKVRRKAILLVAQSWANEALQIVKAKAASKRIKQSRATERRQRGSRRRRA